MTQYVFNAETGTAGNAVTAANSGFTIVTAAGTATATYSATGKAHGALGYRVVSNGGASDNWRLRKDITAAAQASVRAYFTLNSLPSQAQDLIRLFDTSGAALFSFGILSGNTVRAIDAAGATLGSYATALTAGTLYRVEMHWKKGTSTTDGQAAMALFAGDSTTPLWTYGPATNVNVGTLSMAQLWLGANTTGRTTDITWDDILLDDANQVFLGPAVNSPPAVTVSATQNVAAGAAVSLTSTASDVDGSIASRAWSFDYPTSGAPALTGATSASASFTAGAAGSLYILRHTVTDDQGATSFATTEVRVPDAGTITPLPVNGTGTGTWANTGGATSEGAALADGSDATYLESPAATSTEATRRIRLEPSSARSAATITVRVSQSATGTMVAKARLYEGNTLRQEWALTTTTSAADQVLTVSNPGAIGDWGNLYLELAASL